MRTFIDRIILFLLGIICPVFIAACYAAPSNFDRMGKVVGGRVIDNQQRAGIPGLQVTCDQNGSHDRTVLTGPNGYFSFDGECNAILIEDIDGDENGGFYLPRQVTPPEECDGMLIELHH